MKAPITIFIIDDDPDDSELLIEAISEIDHSIVCASVLGSIEALHILSKDQVIIPDYIFLDMNMPRMNGKECLVELKKIHNLGSAKVVVYTTSQREDDVKEMLSLGASYFLIKPSVFNHLKDAIRCIFEESLDERQVQGLYKK